MPLLRNWFETGDICSRKSIGKKVRQATVFAGYSGIMRLARNEPRRRLA
jgi:hypothetical protein